MFCTTTRQLLNIINKCFALLIDKKSDRKVWEFLQIMIPYTTGPALTSGML